MSDRYSGSTRGYRNGRCDGSHDVLVWAEDGERWIPSTDRRFLRCESHWTVTGCCSGKNESAIKSLESLGLFMSSRPCKPNGEQSKKFQADGQPSAMHVTGLDYKRLVFLQFDIDHHEPSLHFIASWDINRKS